MWCSVVVSEMSLVSAVVTKKISAVQPVSVKSARSAVHAVVQCV
jgi:hypothetical protein